MEKMTLELCRSKERIIVTNLAIRWDGWADTLVKHYGWEKEGAVRMLMKRVWCMDAEDVEDCRLFWHHRGFGWQIPYVTAEEWKKGRRVDFRWAIRYVETRESVKARLPIRALRDEDIERLEEKGELERTFVGDLPPVSFFMDEALTLYPARQWQTVHPEFDEYLPQMRKDGVQCYLLGTNTSGVLKLLRDQFDDTYLLENKGKKQKWMFRGIPATMWGKFNKCPESSLDKAMTSGSFTLNLSKWGETYDTSAGVGSFADGGRKADTEEKKPGISPWWALAVVPFVIVALMYMRPVFNWVTGKVLGKSAPAVQQPAAPEPAPVQAPAVQVTPEKVSDTKQSYGQMAASAFGLRSERAHAFGQVRVEQPEPSRELVGIAYMGSHVVISWADGTSSSSVEPQFGGLLFAGVGKTKRLAGVRWEGEEYKLKPRPAEKASQGLRMPYSGF